MVTVGPVVDAMPVLSTQKRFVLDLRGTLTAQAFAEATHVAAVPPLAVTADET